MMDNAVLVIGDSQTKYLYKYLSSWKHYRVTLNAVSGRRVQDVPPSLLSECRAYSYVILHLGTNNVSGEGPAVSARRMEQLVTQIHRENPTCKVYISSVLPRATSQFEEWTPSQDRIDFLKGRAAILNNFFRISAMRLRRCFFVCHDGRFWVAGDKVNRRLLSKDGLHLNPAGQEALCQNFISSISTQSLIDFSRPLPPPLSAFPSLLSSHSSSCPPSALPPFSSSYRDVVLKVNPRPAPPLPPVFRNAPRPTASRSSPVLRNAPRPTAPPLPPVFRNAPRPTASRSSPVLRNAPRPTAPPSPPVLRNAPRPTVPPSPPVLRNAPRPTVPPSPLVLRNAPRPTVPPSPLGSKSAPRPVVSPAPPVFKSARRPPVYSSPPVFRNAPSPAVSPSPPVFTSAPRPAVPPPSPTVFKSFPRPPVAPSPPVFRNAPRPPVAPSPPVFKSARRPAVPPSPPVFQSVPRPAVPPSPTVFRNAPSPAVSPSPPVFTSARRPAVPPSPTVFQSAPRPAVPPSPTVFKSARRPSVPPLPTVFQSAPRPTVPPSPLGFRNSPRPTAPPLPPVFKSAPRPVVSPAPPIFKSARRPPASSSPPVFRNAPSPAVSPSPPVLQSVPRPAVPPSPTVFRNAPSPAVSPSPPVFTSARRPAVPPSPTVFQSAPRPAVPPSPTVFKSAPRPAVPPSPIVFKSAGSPTAPSSLPVFRNAPRPSAPVSTVVFRSAPHPSTHVNGGGFIDLSSNPATKKEFTYQRSCHFCHKSYTTRQSFSYHKRNCKTSSYEIPLQSSTRSEQVSSFSFDHLSKTPALRRKSKISYPRTCDICKKAYQCRQSFSYHWRYCKPAVNDQRKYIRDDSERNHPMTCNACHKSYSNLIWFTRHKFDHPHACNSCSITFPCIYSFREHRNHCIQSTVSCTFTNCNLTFRSKRKMLHHLKTFHLVESTKTLKFNSFAEFSEWKKKEDRTSYSFHKKVRGSATKKETSYTYYSCIFNSNKALSKCYKRKTAYKSKIPNGTCPSEIAAKLLNDGTVKVRYITCHSHSIAVQNLKYHRWSPETQLLVKQYLENGVSANEIRKKFILMKDSNEPFPIKEQFMTTPEISRYKYRLELNKRENRDDATSLKMRVDNMTPEERNSVLVYKPQGCPTYIGNVSFDSLSYSKDLFVYGYQTERQLNELMKGAERVLCIDATHKTNRYDFYLLSLLVPDEYSHGFIVAQFITNHLDTDVLSILFGTIKSRCPELWVNALMTDDDPAIWNAFHYVFSRDNPGFNTKHLLCK